MFSKKIVIRYPADVVEQPIAYRLVKQYDLSFNILKARVSPRREGLMVLELSGTKENFDKGILFLKGCGLKVERFRKASPRIWKNACTARLYCFLPDSRTPHR